MTEQEANKQLVRDYFERCWNQKDLDFGRGFIAEDYNFHMELPDGAREVSRGGIKASVST